ncbi:MAG: RagB/SusD family nutrient uptake outer membrane protein [Bacteroidales bacterium]
MKLFRYISLFFCFYFAGCSLDRYPLDKFSEEAFWTSEENAIIALTGIYKSNIVFNQPEYNNSDWWSYGGLIFLEFASDNAYDRRGSNSNFHKISNGGLLANNPYIKNYWSNSYAKIARCNRFLEGISQIPAPEARKKELEAEARFIRATQYFYLASYFQDVPLVTRILTIEEANTISKTSRAEIIGFITDELRFASEYLPRFKDLKTSGRASKQAALAFLGRTLLMDKQFKEAVTTYQTIIDFGDNIIDPNYSAIFKVENENSKENIFSIEYLQDLAGNAMPRHGYPVKDGGWCLINPIADLFEAYSFSDGTDFSYESPLYESDNLGKNRDPRLNYTLYYDKALFAGSIYDCHPDGNSKDKVGAGQTTQTGFLMRKFYDENYKGNTESYGANIPVIRYAEILLSYLEAKLEAGDPIDQNLLDQTINKIRNRESVNMPHISLQNNHDLREIIRNERRVEFAMEGIRYWDLLRWNIAHINLNKDIYGAPFSNAKNINKKKVNGVFITDKYDRWYVNERKFRKDIDYKWPIPQSEQDINPNLRN